MSSGVVPGDPITPDSEEIDKDSLSSSSSVVYGSMANQLPSANESPPTDSQLPLNRLAELERLYLDGTSKYKGSLSLDALLDCFVYVHQELGRCTLRTDVQLKTNFLDPLRDVVVKVEELRLKKTDFDKIKLIGKGSFGEVSVVRLKGTNEIYALKEIDKASCIRRSDNARFHEERDVLVYGDRKWITNLQYAFQDQDSLFFAMDYYPGGDLVALMSKFEESRVPENVVRFYVAEVALALDSLHQLGYIHRDFKPDNVMIDSKGHVKLGDFGACVKMNEKGKFLSTQACGTPDYISPDVLDVINNGQSDPVQIGKEIDYWGIGVLMYEMLFGEPPFYSEELSLTYCKILNHAETLDIPINEDIPQDITEEARDLIRKLITNKDERLGRNGIQELKAHAFFNGIDWENLEKTEPPYNPSVSGPTDTSNFDDVDFEDERSTKSFHKNLNTTFTPFHLNFIGFTYSLMSSMSEMKPMRENAKQLEAEKSELLRKYQEANALVQSLTATTKTDEEREMEVTIAKLKDQVQILTSQLTEERKAKTVNQPAQDSGLKELKQKVQRLATEKAELQRNLDIANDLVSSKDNEWKQTVSQFRERAEAEVEELTKELGDHKEKIERLEKERQEKSDELVTLNAQHLQMCKDLRTAITAKNIANTKTTSLTEELESLKSQTAAIEKDRAESSEVAVDTGENERLREELKTLNDRHMEIVAQEDKKRKQLVEHYQNQMAELQNQIEAREEDLQRIQKNLQNERTFHSQQLEQQIKNHEAQTDRIQRTLQESIAQLNIENQSLKSEIVKLKSDIERMMVEHKQELKNINGWMVEEAATRGEMEKITKQITNAIESMQLENGISISEISPVKNAALQAIQINSNAPDSAASPMSHWGNRKTNRMARMEAQEAQLALEAEIRNKAELQDELNHFRNNYYGSKAKLDGALLTIDQLKKEIDALKAANFAHQFGGSADALNRTSSFFNIEGPRSSTPREDASDGSPSNFSTMSKKGQNMGNRNDIPSITYENTIAYGSPSSTASTMLAGARISTPKSIQALNNALCARGHQFQHLSLDKPVKCDHCTSILVGLDRQGLVCQCCQYVCHVNCAQKVPTQCPVPRESKRPLGIDPSKGIGTAYEGFVKTPKAGGVKKGWQNMYVAVCDFKLFLYDCTVDTRNKTNDVHPEIRHVLDMRDADFSVTGVAEQDVIHANKSDLGKIFRISTSQIEGTSSETRQGTLLMADNPDERRKWVLALNELVRLLKKSRLPDRSAFRVKEIFDVISLPMIRAAHCATVIDSNKIVLGFIDQGLYCVELDRETLVAVGGEKENSRRSIEQVEFCSQEHLLVVMVGPAKERHIRLVPTAALDGRELKWIKVLESKGCHLMAIGSGEQDQHFLAVAIKKTVVVYKIDRTEKRHHKWKEFAMPGLPQCMNIIDGRLIVGFPHTFRAWPLSTDSNQISLVNMEDQSLTFLGHTQFEAKLFVDVPSNEGKEYLLVFDKLGLYVDAQGRRNRAQELMFPASPKHFAYEIPYLIVYSENQSDIFNVQTAEWIQTINIRSPIPLNHSGLLTMCRVNDVPCVVMLKDVLVMDDPLHLPPEHPPPLSGKKNKTNNKRKFSIRTHQKDNKTGDRLSKLPISGPTDFVHIVHMGPGSVELKNMVDLPQSASTSSSVLGGLLRSTSSTSTNLHSIRPLGGTKSELDAIQKGRQARPQSTASKSSDGSSSLGRDGTMTSSTSGTENAYMEPMSKLNNTVQSPHAMSPSARPQ